jgi:ectoine hydroxylase-related dioxygenase (phytanoyl-CoA dioxygenase family)
MTTSLPPETVAAFQRDGVVHLPAALRAATVARARTAYDWSLANPGPGASRLPARGTGTFYQDLANPAALDAYGALAADSEIGDLIAALWGEPAVWFMYEQVFVKSGGTTRRTPWHQDTSYLPVRGNDLAVLWMSFEPVSAAQALEFVAGSHRGTLFDGSRFDPEDDTAPLYGDGALPRLPDIEASRAAYPIVSWPTEPGDVVIFHPGVLHGGAATTAETGRHTLSLRFFGADATVAARPGRRIDKNSNGAAGAAAVHPLTRMRGLPDGAPFRDPAFPIIRP